jgi:hypothetical protein
MFEVPESDIECVHIDEDVILGKKPVEFIRSSPANNSTNTNETNSDLEADRNIDGGEQKSKAKTYA